jgi:hypothetical protein
MTTLTVSKKQYRENLKAAKKIIKGIDVLVEGGEDFIDLDRAIEAAQLLELVSTNLQGYIKMIKAGA